jgi:hypothetical protein
MSIRDAAAAYIAQGWPVVPIARGTKRAFHDDWTERTYTADHFDDTVNIGIQLGKGIVDIDLDAPEAIIAARALMPITRTQGRKSKPASHYWFYCPDMLVTPKGKDTTPRLAVKTSGFKDLDGTMLLEIRATAGLQTVVPPSVHESGEAIVWEHDRLSLRVSKDELMLPVRATAIATLFGRHWPSGSRHFAAGHLAGFLVRLGFEGPWVANIVKTAAEIARDEEVADRVRVATDTVAKHARGEKTTGGPKLAEMFGRGEELAARCYQWMEREGDELLDQLNEIHFVAHYGSDTIVGTERPGRDLIIQDFDKFKRRYYNRFIGKQRLGEWWLSHAKQRRYREVVFAPPPQTCHDEDYNLWRGFAIEPDPHPQPERRCQRFLEHLFRVICNENQVYFQYLLDILAHTVQYPGKPSGVAVVLRGESGAGKGSFIENFGKLFGQHYIQVDKQDHVTGHFNATLSNRVVVFADEALWAGDKRDAGALKRLITERTLTIERKFLDAATETNCVHLFMATNEKWVWPATFKERRGFVLDIEKKSWADEDYFDALHDAWDGGENAAFLAFCQQRALPGPRLGRLPVTEALAEQQKLSMDPLHAWWLERLTLGEIGPLHDWPTFISNRSLYLDFMRFTEDTNTKYRRSSETLLSNALKDLLPRSAKRTRAIVQENVGTLSHPTFLQKRSWGWQLPPLTHCREVFDKVTGTPFTWPAAEPSEQELSDAVDPF